MKIQKVSIKFHKLHNNYNKRSTRFKKRVESQSDNLPEEFSLLNLPAGHDGASKPQLLQACLPNSLSKQPITEMGASESTLSSSLVITT